MEMRESQVLFPEEGANRTIIQREREYFTNELTLIRANGKTEIFKYSRRIRL